MVKPHAKTVDKPPAEKKSRPVQRAAPKNVEPIAKVVAAGPVNIKRPFHRACAWIAIGAAAAIYIVAMYVIIQT